MHYDLRSPLWHKTAAMHAAQIAFFISKQAAKDKISLYVLPKVWQPAPAVSVSIAYFGAVLYFNHLFCFPLKSVFFTSMQSFGRFRAVDHRSSLPLTNPIFPSILCKNTGTGLLQYMSVCSLDILWLGLKKSGRKKIFMLLQYQKTITVILFCICSGYEPFRIFIDRFK